jgi:uncharacterized protein with HEPN domain
MLSLEEFELARQVHAAVLYHLIVFGERCRILLVAGSHPKLHRQLKKLVRLRNELAHEPRVDAMDALLVTKNQVPQICLAIGGSAARNGSHS